MAQDPINPQLSNSVFSPGGSLTPSYGVNVTPFGPNNQTQMPSVLPQTQFGQQNQEPNQIPQPSYTELSPGGGTPQPQQSSQPLAGQGSSAQLLNPSNAFSFFKQGTGFGNSSGGGGGGFNAYGGLGDQFTGAINSFGESIGFGSGAAAIPSGLSAAETGFLTSAQTAAGVGNAGAFTGATLSGTLGAAGLGFVGGGILANALGENSTGGSIGGGIGAGIGFAVGGPIGALVGGIGGSVFGGMFGNNTPSTKMADFGGNLNKDGTYGGINLISYKGGDKGLATQLGQGISPILQAASSSLGINFNDKVGIQAGYNTLHSGGPTPYYINLNTNDDEARKSMNGTRYFFDPNDKASKDDAYYNVLVNAAAISGYTDTAALKQFYDRYTSGLPTAATPPVVPNNPNSSGPTDWQKYLQNYQEQQNANAA